MSDMDKLHQMKGYRRFVRTVSCLAFGVATLLAAGQAAAQAQLTPSPLSIAYGEVAIGQTVDTTLMLTAGSTAVTSILPTLATPFSLQSTTCTVFTTSPTTYQLASGSSCTMTVRFSPITATSYTGTSMSITSNAPTLTIPLSGTGRVAGGGTLTASPSSLAFGAVRNNTSKMMQFQLTATGANVTLGSSTTTSTSSAIVVPAGYTATHSCGTMIPVGGSCTVSVVFSPTASSTTPPTTKNYDGAIQVRSDATNNPLFVSVTGSGGTVQSSDIPPRLALDLSSHDFGSVVVDQPRVFKFVLTNVGGQTLSNTLSLDAPGFFVNASGCYFSGQVSIAPGTSCELSVYFAPATTGSYTGSLVFSGTGSGNAIINLTGRATGSATGGVLNPYLLLLNGSSFDFGAVPVGSQVSRSVNLRANSSSGVSVTNVSVPEGYGVTHNCATRLQAFDSCSLDVIFSPGAKRAYQGYLIITTDSGNASFVTLSGQGSEAVSLAAGVSGEVQARTLTAYYRFNEQTGSKTGNLYVAFVYRGEVYFLSGSRVAKYVAGTEPQPYSTGPYRPTDITIFNAEDLRQFAGADVYLGYGSSLQDVVDNRQYERVYTLR